MESNSSCNLLQQGPILKLFKEGAFRGKRPSEYSDGGYCFDPLSAFSFGFACLCLLQT